MTLLERLFLTGWAGRQFDTLPELAMHAGIWLMFFGIGLGYGSVQEHAVKWAIATLLVGAIISIPAQIAVERDYHD